MRAAIVGSRTFADYEQMKKFIEDICKREHLDIDTIVSGGARGADSLGEQYANEKGLGLLVFKADWNKYGKRAGFIRNVDIIKNCDVCFAFWDGESHGTKHDIELCKEHNKKCFICRF